MADELLKMEKNSKNQFIPRHDDKGILYLGIEQFLTDETAIDL